MNSSNRGKKHLTKAQKRRRHNIRRIFIFAGFILIFLLILALIVCLISLLFREVTTVQQLDSTSENAVESLSEMTDVSAEEQTVEYWGDSVIETEELLATTEPESNVTLMAVGDNLIHDTVYQYAYQGDGSYDFTEIYRYVQDDIESADIACIQQETIFVSDKSMYSNYPYFGTPSEMADSLTAVGFDVICHASNHVLDKASTGILDTLAKWKEHPEVTVLGIHETEADYDAIKIIEKNGIRIALLDYTYGTNNCKPKEEYYVDLLDEAHKDRIQAQVEQATGMSDIVIVFMHNGTEDSFEPNESQISWAQFFADEGVGLVIGTHPHVIEPTAVLTGKNGNQMPVFYSIGNFVSSQSDAENMVGAIANATITKDESGTYISEYSVEPICTLISREGKYGYRYAFHVYHLEDYTDELAAKHIRSHCTPENFWSIWNNVYEDSPAWSGKNSLEEENAVDNDPISAEEANLNLAA